jgi:hypothetical protein
MTRRGLPVKGGSAAGRQNMRGEICRASTFRQLERESLARQAPVRYSGRVKYRTLEVEIDRGRVLPKRAELLPEKGTGLLTIFDDSKAVSKEPKRVESPLIRCKPGTVIDPTHSELDDSLWD